MDTDRLRADVEGMLPAWPPRTVQELVEKVPDPGGALRAWAKSIGSDFTRVWSECPEGSWALVIAGLVAVGARDEVAASEVAQAMRSWRGPDRAASAAEVEVFETAFETGRYDVPPGSARGAVAQGEDPLLAALHRHVDFDGLLRRSGLLS